MFCKLFYRNYVQITQKDIKNDKNIDIIHKIVYTRVMQQCKEVLTGINCQLCVLKNMGFEGYTERRKCIGEERVVGEV